MGNYEFLEIHNEIYEISSSLKGPTPSVLVFLFNNINQKAMYPRTNFYCETTRCTCSFR